MEQDVLRYSLPDSTPPTPPPQGGDSRREAGPIGEACTGPGRVQLLLREPPRQPRQREVSAEGQPLWHPPEVGNHVLGTLQLRDQDPEFLRRQAVDERPPG